MLLRKDECYASQKDKGHQSFEAFCRKAEAEAKAGREETRQAGQQEQVAAPRIPCAGCSACGGLLSRSAGVIRLTAGRELCVGCYRRLRGLAPERVGHR